MRVWTITFEVNDLWHIYWACLTKVKIMGHSSRSQEENKGAATAGMADSGCKSDLNSKL